MRDFRSNGMEGVSASGMGISEKTYACHVGLDVHKESIAVAVAEAGRAPAAYCGEIANRPAAVGELAERLGRAHGGELIQFSYEAGPCGYEVYRQLTGMGFDCEVVAPSRIPKAPGERIKTDRRDAVKLARLSRGGELTPVWVPDEDREAMRDLVRARTSSGPSSRRASSWARFCCATGVAGRAGAGRGRTTRGWTGSASSALGRKGRFGNIWTRCGRRATGWRR